MKLVRIFLAATFATPVFAGLPSVGPDYQRPATPDQASFADDIGKWKEGIPADAFARGAWWSVYKDKTLNRLIERAVVDNQDLAGAAARVVQARASARAAKADFFPNLTLGASATRLYTTQGGAVPGGTNTNDFQVPLDMTWELDLWGRVRRSVESAKNDALAREASYYTLQLAIQAEIAQNYFSLRAKQAEQDLFEKSIKLRQENASLVQSRVKAGLGTDLDSSRAETELATAQSSNVGISRDIETLRNALALLVGTTPAGLKLDVSPLALDATPPTLPAGLPSELLERRPDIAEAERNLISSNARIGVAKAAFFPAIRLTGSAGFESLDIDKLFNWQSRAWSLGPSISLPIFQGGRNAANLKRSQAVYDESVAAYRQSILTAFREVQDALTGSRLLASQTAFQQKAVTNARQAATLSRKQYEAGLISYFEVIDAERNALTSESTLATLAGQRFVTSTQLVKALGGGWNVTPAAPPQTAAVNVAPAEEASVKKPWYKKVFGR